MAIIRHTVAILALGLTLVRLGPPAQAALSYSPDQIQRIVVEESLRAGLAPELALAVAKVESGYNPAAQSGAGARGVMQIMPATARGEFGVGPDLLHRPVINIRLGVAYLKSLLDSYGSEVAALSHYNGGSRAVRLPPAETRAYVASVLAWKRRYHAEGAAQAIMAGLAPVTPRQTILRPVAETHSARTVQRRQRGLEVSSGDWSGGLDRSSNPFDRW
jgi:soluble lytic murein transglycosylase-like protein